MLHVKWNIANYAQYLITMLTQPKDIQIINNNSFYIVLSGISERVRFANHYCFIRNVSVQLQKIMNN